MFISNTFNIISLKDRLKTLPVVIVRYTIIIPFPQKGQNSSIPNYRRLPSNKTLMIKSALNIYNVNIIKRIRNRSTILERTAKDNTLRA